MPTNLPIRRDPWKCRGAFSADRIAELLCRALIHALILILKAVKALKREILNRERRLKCTEFPYGLDPPYWNPYPYPKSLYDGDHEPSSPGADMPTALTDTDSARGMGGKE